jgi:hypothetical protein
MEAQKVSPSVWIPLGYAFVLVAAGLIQLWSLSNKEKLAPIGELIERIMHRRLTRIAVIFVWWWLGWHFVVA